MCFIALSAEVGTGCKVSVKYVMGHVGRGVVLQGVDLAVLLFITEHVHTDVEFDPEELTESFRQLLRRRRQGTHAPAITPQVDIQHAIGVRFVCQSLKIRQQDINTQRHQMVNKNKYRT